MRLLIVEEEPYLLSSLAEALRKEGYAVDEAGDGKDRLAKALLCDYDAIILDVMLPGMDGLAVLERLRRRKKTPVLMLTACSRTPDRVHGLDTGADDYLAKPCELPELLTRVRAIIRRAAGNATAALKIGDVTVDLAGHTVTQRGEPVALTAREIALIEYLAQHRGRVVTRERLYEHLVPGVSFICRQRGRRCSSRKTVQAFAPWSGGETAASGLVQPARQRTLGSPRVQRRMYPSRGKERAGCCEKPSRLPRLGSVCSLDAPLRGSWLSCWNTAAGWPRFPARCFGWGLRLAGGLPRTPLAPLASSSPPRGDQRSTREGVRRLRASWFC